METGVAATASSSASEVELIPCRSSPAFSNESGEISVRSDHCYFSSYSSFSGSDAALEDFCDDAGEEESPEVQMQRWRSIVELCRGQPEAEAGPDFLEAEVGAEVEVKTCDASRCLSYRKLQMKVDAYS
jgi:hypothetical protein